MARNRGFVSRGHARGTRRETSWLEIEPDVQSVDNTAAITHSLDAATLAKRPFTIIRTRMTVIVSPGQLIADAIQIAAIGIAVVSDQASAIGITAVPTPTTDLDSDLWFVHQSLLGDFTFISAAGFDASGGEVYHIDSKAMRKVNDDQDVVVVVEGATIGDAAIITQMGRFLIKEH